ncbi:hypothetical protein [Brenneria rubrifaciens]|uniref:Uncharacterized protein n=2 Tax=Brenneria rubrifaciens TaxID=55213 RepID=A0A4P8QNU4_9GAMM|nr:hypothetical protein [Brenneria rubrifaciens]QCR08842.1 hypothetical protein EH207_10035 [Brenneria rubrifaciens]
MNHVAPSALRPEKKIKTGIRYATNIRDCKALQAAGEGESNGGVTLSGGADRLGQKNKADDNKKGSLMRSH